MRDDQLPSEAAAQVGLAHVASASFVASRVVPTGGFAVALAGGVALARAAQIAGARIAYGASLAAMLQAIALLGPSRVSVPLTQALSAPLLGRLHARGVGLLAQIGACATIRATDQLALTLAYIAIVAGGVEAYAATYDALAGRIPGVPEGTLAALGATALVLLGWTLVASVVQVLVYRRALSDWPASPRAVEATEVHAPHLKSHAPGPVAAEPRYDPRAVGLAAIVAFCALLVTTRWAVLLAVAGWLAVAWGTARADRAPVRAGLALTALLAGGALLFGLVGGVGLDLTLRRTLRAALLVLVATWLRAAAGERGLREVARRSLRRLRRVPSTAEASVILERLGEDGALGASGRALAAEVRDAPRRPGPLAAAVLRWVAAEAARFRGAPALGSGPALRIGWADRALVAVLLAAVAAVVGAG